MKRVIIIGGGFAGAEIAKNLEEKFDVTLIDSKNYFEFTPGVLRTLIEPPHRSKIQVLHKNYLKKTKIMMDRVKKIEKDKVICKKSQTSFDYLVICSGSKYSPFKEKEIILANRSKELIKYHEKLEHSKKILIIGGGPVGVELASEVCTRYPDKEITLIHAHEKLMERVSKKASDYAQDFLKEHDVKILYNERVEKYENGYYFTNKKNKIKANLAFSCTGITPNSEFLKDSEIIIDKKGFIVVNENLQTSLPNIFAAGDVTNINEEKTAQNAIRQSHVVIKNIKNMEKEKEMEKYISKKTPLVISLGKTNGIFYLEKFVLTGFLPGVLKSLIEKREMLKYKSFF